MTGGTRSRSGCLACRRRKKRCDETKPICQRCQGSGASCIYPNPVSGSFSSRFLISSALQHYTLPTEASERHFINLNPEDVARLCMSYASCDTQSLDITAGIDVDPWSHIPRSVGDTLIDMSEMAYIEYYSEVISASWVYATGNENQYRSLALPFACTHRGSVFFTIMALSAIEMASVGIGQPNRLLSSAARFYNNAVVQLQESLSNEQNAEENLLTCVLLSTFEICMGARPAWLHHLNGAVAIYNRFGSSISRECAIFAIQYFSFRWILLETTMPPGTYPLEEVLGDFSMTARLLQFLNLMTQQNIDARPSVAMQIIDNSLGCSLEFLQLVNRISILSALRFHRQAEESASEEMVDLYSSTTVAFDQALTEMVFIAKVNDNYLDHCSRCFKLAARIFLRLVCLETTIAQTSLIEIQNELLQSLRLVINEDQQRRAFPMWPLFIAGCASFEDEHRQIVLDMFRTLERKWPIGNICLTHRVTTQIWQSRDLNGFDSGRQHDWQKLITTFGWKLALS